MFYILKKGDYTTCDADKPHYSIRSNKIKVIPGEKIITGPAYLTFFNIPTPLIFPFGYFPNNTTKFWLNNSILWRVTRTWFFKKRWILSPN